MATMNLVYPDSWILNRSGKELDGLEGEGTYFINYALYDESKPRPHGAFFTHIEEATKKRFYEVAHQVDYAVCINQRIKKILEDEGVKHVEIIPHGHDPRLKKEIIFGVVGRVYKSGRKGEHLVKKMNEKYKVVGWGKGWPCDTDDNFENIPAFYRLIDYLVVTSLEEGGPVPVIDAIAAGVPVIAPDVGWCWEYPTIHYEKGNWESLNGVLSKLNGPPTWEEWRTKHQKLFHLYSMKS